MHLCSVAQRLVQILVRTVEHALLLTRCAKGIKIARMSLNLALWVVTVRKKLGDWNTRWIRLTNGHVTVCKARNTAEGWWFRAHSTRVLRSCPTAFSNKEEIRVRMNAIMNEYRQLFHLSNSTQDPMQKTQYEAQVQEKRVLLKQLDVKFKQCRSQRNIVKHVIDEQNATASISSQSGAAPTHAVVNYTTSMMQPIQMPAQIQPQDPLQHVPKSMATAPLTSVKPSPDDILGEEDIDAPKVDARLSVAVKPLEVPMDLQYTSAMPASAAAPLNTLTASFKSSSNLSLAEGKGSRPSVSTNQTHWQAFGSYQRENCKMETVPASSDVAVEKQNRGTSSDLAISSTQVQVKEEVAMNPLTMDNSKLNEMVVEHRRMDASTMLPLPAGAVETPKELIAIGGN
ncbi:hypothetical protein PsorP6_012816 [Peronosclerospora sorghi]|uniref:Uncharacterized protein n=1 Tax=Peronosclerospora sorghi TaxID=230839 RepID=A0ACC0WIK2_9STRA|nr:hypothetical protein PsorP6_012816 [Peronosclerospora sorghi]